MSYREPGRDVDDTEIQATKIREAEETKRVKIKSRTELWKAHGEGAIVTGAILAGIFLLCATFGGGLTYSSYLDHKYPRLEPPGECIEKTEMININDSVKTCSSGAHIETTTLPNDRVLYKCVCPHRDAGAP